MKNLLLGFALVAGVCACSSPSQKDSVSDAAKANAAKPECEAGKAGCCSEKAKGSCTEGKVCPATGKVQG